jgi:hypothetical protein
MTASLRPTGRLWLPRANGVVSVVLEVVRLGVVVLVGLPSVANAQDWNRLFEKRATLDATRLRLGVWDTNDGRHFSMDKCAEVAEELRKRLDYSSDPREKARLRPILQKTADCAAAVEQLASEIDSLSMRCQAVELELMRNESAPEGSDARKRMRKGYDACIRAIDLYEGRVEKQLRVVEAVVGFAPPKPPAVGRGEEPKAEQTHQQDANGPPAVAPAPGVQEPNPEVTRKKDVDGPPSPPPGAAEEARPELTRRKDVNEPPPGDGGTAAKPERARKKAIQDI